ncbi:MULTISPECIES: DUF3958 family protein [Listeria]|uniref:DUF3958 family protein n=1 Tax=Listeria TaxID=1637 RepID=UPI000B590A8C|nr:MULTISPECIES: DUF3958 family protein [Listeria]
MNEWEKLNTQERVLLEQEDHIRQEIKQLSYIKAQYDSNLREGRNFIHECEQLFHKSDKPYFYQQAMDEFSYESRQAITYLEETEETTYREKKKMEQELNDVMHHKRKLALAAKESNL